MKRDFTLNTFWGRLYAKVHALLVEHNFINYLRLNFHAISEEAYRSAQPTMGQLERYSKKHGIKTIINLKGENPAGSYFLFEKEKCEALGLKLVNVGIMSRGIPEKERIAKAKEIFESAQYPIWMHCKAGADRTGIYATLYQYFRQHTPIKETNQLDFIPFGHVKASKAGKVDLYFDTFVAYQAEHPDAEFYHWSQEIANKEQMEQDFTSSPLADFINDKILRRE
jgi:protein tyrosine phosphatase (PTP) superfamily phosphohydrolase (DUF442 family)